MTDTVLARLAELKTMDIMALKASWRELFATEPPPYNRKFLESRLAYRIQELAYGGLKPETLKRLAALADELEAEKSAGNRHRNAVALLGRPHYHRHTVERLGILRSEEPEQGTMNAPSAAKKPMVRKLRCAVYTRKSSEEGLDMEFNSLDAQREACEAYVASQRAEGWVLVPDRYDDGGISGATLERPSLKRLLRDIEAGLIDVVVVYKIDRLSRSLMDFSRLVEVFDGNEVTFVAVTQSFNTTTSMGRLTLNILLSFAQFEREVIGERIRDKFAASRRKGMWMGGHPPLGYQVKDRKLVVVECDAAIVRMIFARFIAIGSATTLARKLVVDGIRTNRGRLIDKGILYRILNNRTYIGEAVHKGANYPGEHDGIVPQSLWDKVHAILAESPRKRAGQSRRQTPALLKGLLFGPTGCAMSPTHTRKGGRLYRYYVSQSVLKLGPETCPIRRVPAAEIENAVVDQLRALLRTPEMIVRTWVAARSEAKVSETEVRDALVKLDPLWNELFPAEQARIVQLLVERVDVGTTGIAVRLRTEGLASLVTDMRKRDIQRAA